MPTRYVGLRPRDLRQWMRPEKTCIPLGLTVLRGPWLAPQWGLHGAPLGTQWRLGDPAVRLVRGAQKFLTVPPLSMSFSNSYIEVPPISSKFHPMSKLYSTRQTIPGRIFK